MADVNTDLGSSRLAAEGKSPAGEPMWDLIELLFFAYRDFVGDPDEVLGKLGFGRAHHRVLHFVNRNPGMTVADLLDILAITKQSLGRVLKQMLDEGYVVQKEGPNDRRQRLLYVTPRGEALALKLAGLQTERLTRALNELGPGAPHLLVVDDDRRIRDLLSRFLSAEGFRVTTADNAKEARAKLTGLSFDLLILDVMMPGESGFDLAKFIRTTSSVPILMLTARDEAESRIKGLEIGADDYLPKPFEPRELSLRVGNILKRAQPAAAPAVESVRFGPFVFHIGRGELRKGEDVIRITDREREMLRVLSATPGETVTREALAGNGGNVSERAVDVQVNRLRRKIERNPANPLLVQTVRGIGYRLVLAS